MALTDSQKAALRVTAQQWGKQSKQYKAQEASFKTQAKERDTRAQQRQAPKAKAQAKAPTRQPRQRVPPQPAGTGSSLVPLLKGEFRISSPQMTKTIDTQTRIVFNPGYQMNVTTNTPISTNTPLPGANAMFWAFQAVRSNVTCIGGPILTTVNFPMWNSTINVSGRAGATDVPDQTAAYLDDSTALGTDSRVTSAHLEIMISGSAASLGTLKVMLLPDDWQSKTYATLVRHGDNDPGTRSFPLATSSGLHTLSFSPINRFAPHDWMEYLNYGTANQTTAIKDLPGAAWSARNSAFWSYMVYFQGVKTTPAASLPAEVTLTLRITRQLLLRTDDRANSDKRLPSDITEESHSGFLSWLSDRAREAGGVLMGSSDDATNRDEPFRQMVQRARNEVIRRGGRAALGYLLGGPAGAGMAALGN